MIPIIDLSPLFSSKVDGIQEVAIQLYQVYSTVGFAQVINHQVPQQVIEDLYFAAKAFHHLSPAEKHKLKFTHSLRGYIPINVATLRRSELGAAKKPNQSESFLLIPERQKGKWSESAMGGKQMAEPTICAGKIKSTFNSCFFCITWSSR